MASAARTQTDAGLLGRALGGSEAAFDELLAPLLEPTYKLAMVMLRDQEEARDAVQESSFTAWRKLGQLRDEDQFRPWFLTVVANRCRSVLRSRWWQTLRLPLTESPRVLDHGALAADLDLRRALAGLSAADRAALFLLFYLDLPLSEVGRVLNVSAQAAKSRVHRAVLRLRMAMQEVIA